jgi:hypothetical protein
MRILSRAGEELCPNALTTFYGPVDAPIVAVREYIGRPSVVKRRAERDERILWESGWHSTSVKWTPGQYSNRLFLVGMLGIFLFIGFLILVWMVLTPPPGHLLVRYEKSEIGE